MRTPPTATLAAAILLALAGAPAEAQEPPPAPAQAPVLDEDRPPPPPPYVPPPPPPGWIDETHALLEQELGGMTGWVDRFFGDERDADLEPAASELRWRNELRYDDRNRVAARTRLRAALALPGLERRLARASLVLTGESLADPSRGISDEANAGAGLTPTLRAEQASLDLRFQLWKRPATVVDAGPGVGLRWPLEGHLAARLRQRLGPVGGFSARFTQVAFYSTRDRFGTSSDLDVDRPLAEHLLLRWRNRGLLSEVSKGLEWGSELGLAYDLQALRLGLYLGGAVSGATRPMNDVTVYRIFTRVRRDVWRRWLFLELEPEVLWPTAPPLGRHKEHAITLRLEIAFDGRAPQAPPPVTP
ncbi:MAG: hypothetical protein HZB56_04730 [Deltaproteobacteria bacterium]|nr:hypothetical protein [Deltaproteobacteria bacterium]